MDEQERLELEFLRYFYDEVGEYMGAGDDDVYESIKDAYIRLGHQLPEVIK